MSVNEHHIGQRLSLKGQLCTIRYIGPVSDKSGEWLGVEWDDASRGKHDGTHDEVKYFQCRSSSSTAASFLRPKQSWDKSRTFLEAVREKYMPEDAGTGADIVYFSGKKAEEVGFDKFAKRQAQLQGIHVLVLDHMRVTREHLEHDREAISEICANITDVDLGSNLFESLDDILEIAKLLPKLRNLALDGNRLTVGPARDATLEQIKSLSLSDTLLSWPEICTAASCFPRLASLTVSSNELQAVSNEPLPASLEILDLAGNLFTNLTSLSPLHACQRLHTLSLKGNRLSVADPLPINAISATIATLDLSHNAIRTWSVINSLTQLYPSLQHLRTTSNPLYTTLASPSGKPLTPEDGYMLTIARLPNLKTLNYSTITAKERLNAETYYLNQIAAEIGLVTAGAKGVEKVKAAHPRWSGLVEEYGEPIFSSAAKGPATASGAHDPNSLAAKLATLTFYLSDSTLAPHIPPEEREWNEEVPKSFDIYSILGRVGKKLCMLPMSLRLIWETGVWDPVQRGAGMTEVEEWDSEDEEDDGPQAGREMVKREVELVGGTRPLGTYIEGREARIRVEVKQETTGTRK